MSDLDYDRHWIVWDGECGYCRRWVRWALDRDRRGLFQAIPYQDVPSPPMTAELRAALFAPVGAGQRAALGGRA